MRKCEGPHLSYAQIAGFDAKLCRNGCGLLYGKIRLSGFDVLIVENDKALGELWSRHLERSGNRVVLRHDQHSAMQTLQTSLFDVVVVNVLLRGGSAFLISDAVRAQHPDTPVIFVNNTGFFADGSIFALSPNARAYVRPDTPPEDLTAMIEHFAKSA